MEGELSSAYGWLIAGGVLLALEAFGIPGIGFLFAGLAAIVVGLLVHLEVISPENLVLQAGAFCGITAMLAALLWKTLKNWRTNPEATERFSNIIGDMATVGKGGLEKGSVGQASWSGTTMMAEIDPACSLNSFDEGTLVQITAVKGNHLFVAPRADSQ